MQAAKDTVGTDIIINKGGNSILHMPHNASFCEPLYEFIDKSAFDFKYLNEFSSSQTQFFTYELWDFW